ncbi:MAG: hypothetical protein SFU87_00865 [Chitinophagaceae bacterium]|nr:hypothetical protein [Chitinophagaceae bacterium]
MKTGNNNTSSTEQFDREIKDLFEKFIAKAHADVAAGRKKYFPAGKEAGAASYYEMPQHPDFAHYSFIDTGSQESFKAFLEKFWNGLGSPEFAAMAEPLSNLAFKLKDEQKEQSTELSPFVYVMY